MKKKFLGFFSLVLLSLFGITNASTMEITYKEEIACPAYLYKIVSPEQWQESLVQKEIVTTSMDKDFIHLATEAQVAHVTTKFWSNKDYIILKLNSKALVGRLVYETNRGGTDYYYHLYDGKIPLSAVVESSAVHTH